MCIFTNSSCYSACIRVLHLYPFDLPYFSSQLHKVTICGRHVMASVRDINIAKALLVQCLEFDIVEIELLWLYISRYGVHISRVYHCDWQMGSVPLVESLYDMRNTSTITLFLTLLVIGWLLVHGKLPVSSLYVMNSSLTTVCICCIH